MPFLHSVAEIGAVVLWTWQMSLVQTLQQALLANLHCLFIPCDYLVPAATTCWQAQVLHGQPERQEQLHFSCTSRSLVFTAVLLSIISRHAIAMQTPHVPSSHLSSVLLCGRCTRSPARGQLMSSLVARMRLLPPPPASLHPPSSSPSTAMPTCWSTSGKAPGKTSCGKSVKMTLLSMCALGLRWAPMHSHVPAQ